MPSTPATDLFDLGHIGEIGGHEFSSAREIGRRFDVAQRMLG